MLITDDITYLSIFWFIYVTGSADPHDAPGEYNFVFEFALFFDIMKEVVQRQKRYYVLVRSKITIAVQKTQP